MRAEDSTQMGIAELEGRWRVNYKKVVLMRISHKGWRSSDFLDLSIGPSQEH